MNIACLQNSFISSMYIMSLSRVSCSVLDSVTSLSQGLPLRLITRSPGRGQGNTVCNPQRNVGPQRHELGKLSIHTNIQLIKLKILFKAFIL